MKYLLDTCVISEVIKKEPNKNVIAWLQAQDEDNLFLSILTRKNTSTFSPLDY